MLRWTVAVLIAANLVFFAWTRGWLDPLVGVGPQGDREPQRLQQQVHPERVQVQPLDASAAEAPEGGASGGAPALEGVEPAASAASAAGPAASAVLTRVGSADTVPACLEAGPFDNAELRTAQTALAGAGLAPARWQTPAVPPAPVWLVYMGRFTDLATLQRKEDELRRIHVGFQEVHATPAFEPGLSLGRFGDQAAAEDARGRLAQRGVHTARIVALTTTPALHLLRLTRLDPALAARLQALPWPLAGSGLRACAATTAAVGRESAAASAG